MENQNPEFKIQTNDEAEKNILSKKYSGTKQIISFIETALFFIFILILVFTGLSVDIKMSAYDVSSNSYMALLIFFGIIGIAEGIISLPFGIYSDYILEHKYNLSNQTLYSYFKEKIKGTLLGIVLGVPMLMAFYYILLHYGNYWWLILGFFIFFVSVILGRLAPTLIFPLFYKFKPLENDNLNNSILELCRKTGIQIKGIFTFDMSKNTKKANAAFTGIGKSKRIIIGDTLLDNFTIDEIKMVFSHEMGHYKKRHIVKLMTLSTLMTFLGLYVTAELYKNTLGWFGFSGISDIAALPLLILYLSLFGLVTTPITNILSRKFEWEADTFALETTQNKSAFVSAMKKLADQNLSDKSPNKIIEFLFHSHPSIEKRISFAENYTFQGIHG